MTRALLALSLGFVLAAASGALSPAPEASLAATAAPAATALPAAGQASGDAGIEPYTIAVPDDVLTDLRERLERARLPDEPEGVGWDLGTNQAYLRELIDYWRDEFDWRAAERRLNEFDQFTTNIGGLDVHFVHQRAADPDAFPLILTHGWPGSFAAFAKVIGPLTDPAAHGGDAADAFHVVVPSIPGYGFSDRPPRMGYGRDRTAEMFAELMARLGYERYGAQGGDLGAGISRSLALDDAEHVAGLHLNLCGGAPPDPDDPTAGVSEEELALLRDRQAFWTDEERGYSHIQGTKPQTLGYGLNDSPVGLAAWIVEKYRSWCDCDGHPETRFSKDELLTTITIYWVTQTATSAARYYYEGRHGPPTAPRRVEVPTACAAFPKELIFTPQRWLEAGYNLTRYTIMPSGGHFAAGEVPELFVDDVRAFFRDLREAGGQAQAASEDWTVTRTAWGDPDLEGTWSFATITPLERPERYAGRDRLTAEEVTALNADALTRGDQPPPPGDPGAYNAFWFDRGESTGRTSLIVDPPDGRIPFTAAGSARRDARRALLRRPAHGPEDRTPGERCTHHTKAGPPMSAGGYNNHVRLLQAPGYVVVWTEQNHDARIVPLDGRPRIADPIRQWMGDSRGRWEGDTLVVETTNFNGKAAYQGTADGMHLVERFTRTAPDAIRYEYTVSDPETYTRPWTASIDLQPMDGDLYEFACHEGNYGMEGILAGARADERKAAVR